MPAADPEGTARRRPAVVAFVTGTGTEVGKTWVSARVLETLRSEGLAVAARKPAQSFQPGEGPTDAEVLGRACGAAPSEVCPPERSYPVPMAPPMAAAALGRAAPLLAGLADGIRWPAGLAVGLVEGAGGLASPVAEDGDNLDLARAVGADVLVLVAGAALGTIHDVRLASRAVRAAPGGPGVVVFLNRYDPADELHRANRTWLEDHDGLDVVTEIPALAATLRDGSFPAR